MSKKLAELSRTEWLVMNSCWQQGKSTARQIYEDIAHIKDWEYQTVKTMLDRLVIKGYLKRSKLGPLCLFKPAVPQKKTRERTIDKFKKTVLGGSVTPLLAYLVKEQLNDEEVDRLKELIERYEEKDE